MKVLRSGQCFVGDRGLGWKGWERRGKSFAYQNIPFSLSFITSRDDRVKLNYHQIASLLSELAKFAAASCSCAINNVSVYTKQSSQRQPMLCNASSISPRCLC